MNGVGPGAGVEGVGGGLKEVTTVCSFETLVSLVAFRKWSANTVVLSFRVTLLATEMLYPKGQQDRVEPEVTNRKELSESVPGQYTLAFATPCVQGPLGMGYLEGEPPVCLACFWMGPFASGKERELICLQLKGEVLQAPQTGRTRSCPLL